MAKLFGSSLLCIHLFSCFFYLSAKLNNEDSGTWVYRKDLDYQASIRDLYINSIYWAAQTLTTVGYGDFGAENSLEMVITIIWMLLGAAFYSVVVGSLTSVIINANSVDEELNRKLRALELFAIDSNLDSELHNSIRQFIYNNYSNMYSKIEEELIIMELPPTLKEEVLFHQYGKIMFKFAFFENINNNDFVWSILQKIIKISFDRGDVIYTDDKYANSMYLIH
jgi:hypothetical protein